MQLCTPNQPVAELLGPLRAALDGAGPALLPVPDGAPGQALLTAARPDDQLDDDTALLLPTSGSTGVAKVVELPAAALIASAEATHERLGGPGDWLLCLPLTHIAGWQVVVRSAVAGTRCQQMDPVASFTPAAFIAAANTLGPRSSHRRYTSLVPTQLGRLLEDRAAAKELAGFDGVLVGGASCPPPLLDRAREAGVVVHTTYGMTETSGGCVYDGEPLRDVRVRLDEDRRILLSGPQLARRYRGEPDLTAESFVHDETGTRWFRTSDAGALTGGRLQVLGRIDDVITTGGEKVSPAEVERVLLQLPAVRAAIVVGVPDPEWGQAVVALVEGDPAPDLAVARELVAERLGRHAAPRHLLAVGAVPLRGIGKPDRLEAARIARERLA
ncbi:MAG TPA: o-succinylbenzoate--CoA ligase [Actinomycetales bacterium]|nr:o-succinylbenzoate--CoA ligase [Actinomycetales bacterium]